MPNKDQLFYLNELRSDGCACGQPKKVGYSFCYPCYMKLPFNMRQDLYNKMDESYKEAYEKAIDWLDL